MSYCIVSTSLNPTSRSRILCRAAHATLEERGVDAKLLDLREFPLPLCDGKACYGDPRVVELGKELAASEGILLGVPIYCYDVSPSARNLVTLGGRDAWADKVVGFLCAAGGHGSYQSVMALASSMMLDFRSVVIPRFVYATGEAFEDGALADPEVSCRVEELADELVRFSQALKR